MKKITVNILGQMIDLSIKDGSEDDFRKIVYHYTETIKKIQSKYPSKSSMEICVLAGLTITEEFYSFAAKKGNLNLVSLSKMEELINDSIKELDKNLQL